MPPTLTELPNFVEALMACLGTLEGIVGLDEPGPGVSMTEQLAILTERLQEVTALARDLNENLAEAHRHIADLEHKTAGWGDRLRSW